MGKKKKDDLEQYKDITVANMNVDGMPWYIGKAPEDVKSSGDSFMPEETLTPKETKHLMVNALLAALLVGGVFILAFFLFILFCVYVWF